jgi:hypothetical protein
LALAAPSQTPPVSSSSQSVSRFLVKLLPSHLLLLIFISHARSGLVADSHPVAVAVAEYRIALQYKLKGDATAIQRPGDAEDTQPRYSRAGDIQGSSSLSGQLTSSHRRPLNGNKTVPPVQLLCILPLVELSQPIRPASSACPVFFAGLQQRRQSLLAGIAPPSSVHASVLGFRDLLY